MQLTYLLSFMFPWSHPWERGNVVGEDHSSNKELNAFPKSQISILKTWRKTKVWLHFSVVLVLFFFSKDHRKCRNSKSKRIDSLMWIGKSSNRFAFYSEPVCNISINLCEILLLKVSVFGLYNKIDNTKKNFVLKKIQHYFIFFLLSHPRSLFCFRLFQLLFAL